MTRDAVEDNKVFTSEGFKEVSDQFKKFQEDMKNPLVVGALLTALKEERESTNLILKELNAKLDRLVERFDSLEKKHSQEILLPEVDEEILAFVREKDRVDAEEVQAHFQYKGKNAASARLNGLYRQGVLDKRQVGKKVYFLVK